MLLTIDVKESALDKILNLLNNLKSDVKIVDRSDALDIDIIAVDDEDYKHILKGREERKTHPENYGRLSDIDWN